MNYVIMLSLVLPLMSLCMERDSSSLPLELIRYIVQCNKIEKKTIRHTMHSQIAGELLALPFTIAPELLKMCWSDTQLGVDLSNPTDGELILPNAQLWCDHRDGKYRLSEDIRRTNDIYKRSSGIHTPCSFIFDGINSCNKALHACKHNDNQKNPYFIFYMFTQSSKYGEETTQYNHRHMLQGNGLLYSLMLHSDSNRFMYSVKEDENGCMLYIKDLVDNLIDPLKGASINIASRATACPFIKTVSLGKDTYFGITKRGNLFSIWLNKKNKIKYKKQKFSACPKKFVDISVDNSVETESGFKPRVAFLTKNGEIFITDLTIFSQPTLVYVTQVLNHKDVKRLYYKDQKLTIMYQNSKDVFVWDDSAEMRFLTFSMKRKLNDNVLSIKDK